MTLPKQTKMAGRILATPIPSFQFVKTELVGRVAVVKYNRPRSGNSLHPVLLAEMVSAMSWADQSSEVDVIVQTGEGKFFCTGMELMDLNPDKPMSFKRGSDFHRLNEIIIKSQKILIAAVNGSAAGYGVSSLALFDLVYSVPDAYFFTPFVKWGMAAEGASSVSFSKIMGHQKTAGLFLAGDRISASQADRLGLLTGVLDKEDFLHRVMAIAQRMAESPQGALRATKQLMRHTTRQDLLDANDREADLIHSERHNSVEYNEAVARFRTEQEAKAKAKSRL